MISQSEKEIIDKVEKKKKLPKRSLNGNEQNIARSLVSKGILNRTKGKNGLQFSINQSEDIGRI